MNISEKHTQIAENEVKVYLAAANKCAPYIGENGNWYVWSLEESGHIDTGIKAEGQDGDTPERGVDYWTEEEKEEISDFVEERVGETEDALSRIIQIQESFIRETPNVVISGLSNLVDGASEGSVRTVGSNNLIGDYSFARGYQTTALSDYSDASGFGCIAGCKGYYYSSIDFNSKQITLTKEQGVAPMEPFLIPYEIDDVVTIINGSPYEECTTITEVRDNVITVKDLPFSEIAEVIKPDRNAYSLRVPQKPFLGEIVFGECAHADGENTRATGVYSHSEGYETEALGAYSHTEGRSTIAHYCSHAEGHTTKATGHQSHSEGYLTEATGSCSHAEGRETKAIGKYSHSEGYNTTASGNYSLATGHETVASGLRSYAEGYKSVAKGDSAHAEGRSTMAEGQGSHAEGGSTMALGESSHAEGNRTQAAKFSAHAEGYGSQAIGEHSHAEGNITQALGESSHAEGYQSKASGVYSHAEGAQTSAEGGTAHSEGKKTIASGDNSHAEGYQSKAIGYMSHAEGFNTEASGECAHSEGSNTVASAKNAHSEGSSTKAIGTAAHAEGLSTQAIGHRSHAEGWNTKAEGDASHAEGRETSASGLLSHAEGKSTEARGYASHTEGTGTIATLDSQHVEGRYNIEDSEKKYLHIAGNGKSGARSNAHTLDWNGNAWYAGDVDNDGDITCQGKIFCDDVYFSWSSTDDKIGNVSLQSRMITINTWYNELIERIKALESKIQ